MNDFQRYLADEFVEDYAEGRLSRRDALKLIASVVGSFAMAQTFLVGCAPPPAATQTAAPTAGVTPDTPVPPTDTTTAPTAEATQTLTMPPDTPAATQAASSTVSPEDPAIQQIGMVEFPSGTATVMGYLVQPAGEGPFPVMLICHENRGLTEHIKDVARRAAKAGYVGLAVDLLSRQGGSETISPTEVPGMLGNSPPEQFVEDFVSGWKYLQTQPFAATERVGMVGFCFGGGVTWRVAVGMPELKAAVPFYGPHPAVEDVPKIQAAVRAIYAGRDDRINQGIPPIEAAMQEAGKIYEKIVYPDVDHAFHNDTGQRYNAAAAQDAWAKTLEWFAQYV